MNPQDIVERLKAIEPELRAEGIAHLAIFGSRARGDHRPDSDVDLLLDIATDMPFSLLNLVGAEHIVQDTLGLPANAFLRRSLEPEFRRSIAAETIEVF